MSNTSPRRFAPMKMRHFALSALAATALAACGGSDNNEASLKLNLSGLENLGSAAVYEGWLVTAAGPVSSGRFTVDASGKLSQTEFNIPRAQADAATAFVLTIEPAANDVAAPTATHLLAGDFNADKTMATVSVQHAAALGNNFSSAAGSFILATPSSASTTDDNQGIWWLKMVDGAPQASLTLPTLPAGWVYEGWVVVNGTPLSTGRFTSVSAADSDGSGSTAGPLAAPPFPGQDFITPPLVLPGGMAVISIEPEPDNSAAPFTLKPLLGPIGGAVGGANSQTMTNNTTASGQILSGSVSLSR